MNGFFKFSRRQLSGILMLWLLIGIVVSAPTVYRGLVPDRSYAYEDLKQDIARFEASEIRRTTSYTKRRYDRAPRAAPVYFPFDPNTLDESGWIKLGVRTHVAKIIRNYVNKGGHFYKKQDLLRIYAMDSTTYHQLEPYIVLAEKKVAPKDNDRRPFAARKPITVIDLNTADSVQLDALPGIGGVFAGRILKYRDRLGGFYAVHQLREVYGLDSALFLKLENRLSVQDPQLRMIPLNTGGFAELRHPYLTYKQINGILNYRKQHGPYKFVDDLLKTGLLPDETLMKIRPYLAL